MKTLLPHANGVPDLRRLVVSPLPPSPFTSGIWHPNVGQELPWRPSMGPGAIPKIVSYEEIGLSEDLAEEFQAWIECLTSAGQTGDDFPFEAYKARGRALAESLAEFVGDRYQVEYEGKRIIPGLTVEPLSRNFIFGRKHAGTRNKWDFTTPFCRTYLATLLWRQMTQEDRCRLFPGRFDLGNKKTVPTEQCTYAALARELEFPGFRGESITN